MNSPLLDLYARYRERFAAAGMMDLDRLQTHPEPTAPQQACVVEQTGSSYSR